MAIAYPRPMPAVGVAEQLIDIQLNDALSPENGGRLGAMQTGYPLWTGDWLLGRVLTDAQADEWVAWIDSLGGSKRRFISQDFARPRPRAYIQSGFPGAFGGSATSWSQTITSAGQGLLQLNGLPVGLVLTRTDCVGFKWTTGGEARRTMARGLETVVANGSGVAVVTVEPPLPALVPSNAVAHLDSPGCLMRLVSGQTRKTAMDRRKIPGARIVALQDLAE